MSPDLSKRARTMADQTSSTFTWGIYRNTGNWQAVIPPRRALAPQQLLTGWGAEGSHAPVCLPGEPIRGRCEGLFSFHIIYYLWCVLMPTGQLPGVSSHLLPCWGGVSWVCPVLAEYPRLPQPLELPDDFLVSASHLRVGVLLHLAFYLMPGIKFKSLAWVANTPTCWVMSLAL